MRGRARVLVRAALALALGAAGAPRIAAAHEAEARGTPPSPPAEADSGRLFEPPAAGSYELPAIRQVREHWLLASDGQRAPLPGLAPDEVAVVSFVYSSCPDACPLALAALQRLDRALAQRPALAGRVRLASVSFDPVRDTPQRMAELRRHLAPQCRWGFFTAQDRAEIAPVLADYGQDALPLVGPQDRDTGRIGHVLKVFLVDGHGDVRNIYSLGFLDAGILLNDIETLLDTH